MVKMTVALCSNLGFGDFFGIPLAVWGGCIGLVRFSTCTQSESS